MVLPKGLKTALSFWWKVKGVYKHHLYEVLRVMCALQNECISSRSINLE